MVTTAIANRAESAIFKGLGVFAKSAKSLGFCFVQKKKKKQNPKVLLSAWRKDNRLSPALLAIAEPVNESSQKKTTYDLKT